MSNLDLLAELLAQHPALFSGVCLVLGMLVGSFLNVVIYRVPLMMERQWRDQCAELADTGGIPLPDSEAPNQEVMTAPPFNLVVPRSACPTCKAPITAIQNIPVISYLFLRGKCASCGARISPRYPLIEALTGILSAAVAWKLGFGWPAACGLVLTWYLVALTFIDVDHQLLPDSLTLPLLWLGLVASLWVPVGNGAPLPVDTRTSLIGAASGYASLWLIYHLFRLLTGKEGMGYGDFKLFAALGAWLGWQMLLPIILIAAAVGAVCGIVILWAQKQGRSTPIAFGPYLAASGWLMLIFGQDIVQRYMGLFAPHS